MAEETQLKTFLFRGQIRYCCPTCPFDHYTEIGVLKHWKELHADKAPANSGGPTLFGADNKPIERQEEEMYVPPELQGIGTRTAQRDDDTEELRPDTFGRY